MNKLQIFIICIIRIGFSLGVAGFFIPPFGVIDGSIISFFGELLVAVGILMGWDTIKDAIKKGADATVKVGNTEVSIDCTDEDKNEK